MGIILAIIAGIYLSVGFLLTGLFVYLCWEQAAEDWWDFAKTVLGLFFAWPFYLK